MHCSGTPDSLGRTAVVKRPARFIFSALFSALCFALLAFSGLVAPYTAHAQEVAPPAQNLPTENLPAQDLPGDVPLTVNGISVEGATTGLVSGTTYAPAQAFAEALGARYRFDADASLLSLEYGGRLLLLRSFSEPEAASAAEGAGSLGGGALSGPGALLAGGRPYLPVKSVATALGGRTAQLAEQRVVVVFPRPELTQVAPPSVWGRAERFILFFSAPVVLEELFEPSSSLGVVRFRFFRAALGGASGAATRRYSGGRFSDAAFVEDASHLDFNVTLRDGNRYSVFSEPFGGGERVIIDLFAPGAEHIGLTANLTTGPTGDLQGGSNLGGAPAPIIIDAGEGTLALAREVRRVLEARGLPAQLSWEEALPDPALRMRAGIGAPLFISLARAPLGAERFNLYYLTEDSYLDGENGLNGENGGALAEALGAGIRQVTPERLAELDPAARARLEPLVANLAQGRALARLFGVGLEARTELELGELGGAPLYLLSGAAGRGVMLELSTDVPASPGLVAAIADTLLEALPLLEAVSAPLSESP